LIGLDAFKERFEIALAKSVIAFALDELKEDRTDDGLREDLQQDAGFAAIHDTFAVDQNPVLHHTIQRLFVTHNTGLAHLVIGNRRGGHEADTALKNLIGRRVDIVRAYGYVLNSFAIIPLEIFDNLAFFTAILIDGNTNAPAWRGQRAAEKPRAFARDIKEPDLVKIESRIQLASAT